MKKRALKTIGIWIMFLSSIALMYFSHLVVLNIKSYDTLGVQASGEVDLIPVIYSISVMVLGYAIYKIGAEFSKKMVKRNRPNYRTLG
jgi:hypothetical protein